jgi:hypothetical protein
MTSTNIDSQNHLEKSKLADGGQPTCIDLCSRNQIEKVYNSYVSRHTGLIMIAEPLLGRYKALGDL